MGCDRLNSCSFFTKFKNDTNQLYQLMIQSYCNGCLSVMCKRKEYETKESEAAPGALCPSGYYSE